MLRQYRQYRKTARLRRNGSHNAVTPGAVTNNDATHNHVNAGEYPDLHHNVVKIYALGFFSGLQLIVPVFVPLLQRHNLTMGEVLQTQALFAFMVAVLELPSGYLADRIGRKSVLCIGSFLAALASLVMLRADSFADFLLFEALMGIAVSLSSGADIALLYDTRSAAGNDPRENSKAFGRLLGITSAAECLAGIFACILMFYSMDTLLLFQFLFALVPLGIACSLTEPPRHTTSGDNGLSVKNLLGAILFERQLVLWVAAAVVCFGVVGLMAFWVHQKYWQLAGIDVRYFGLVWAGFCLLRGVAASVAHQLEDRFGYQKLLYCIAILPVIALSVMAFANPVFGVFAGALFPIMRGLSFVILIDALNRRISGTFRATINSAISLATRAVFIVTAPLLGLGIDSIGVQHSLIGLLLVFTPMVLFVSIRLVTNSHAAREDSNSSGCDKPSGNTPTSELQDREAAEYREDRAA